MKSTYWLVSCRTGEYVTDGHGDAQTLLVAPTELEASECIDTLNAWARSHKVEWLNSQARRYVEDAVYESFPIEGVRPQISDYGLQFYMEEVQFITVTDLRATSTAPEKQP